MDGSDGSGSESGSAGSSINLEGELVGPDTGVWEARGQNKGAVGEGSEGSTSPATAAVFDRNDSTSENADAPGAGPDQDQDQDQDQDLDQNDYRDGPFTKNRARCQSLNSDWAPRNAHGAESVHAACTDDFDELGLSFSPAARHGYAHTLCGDDWRAERLDVEEQEADRRRGAPASTKPSNALNKRFGR